jgi:CheY-like chemotaxis protein
MKVLFVDEDWEVEVLAKVLQARHIKDDFDIADTLAIAREKIWNGKYDVIVMDVMMPADETAVPQSSEKAGLLSGLLLFDMIRADAKCPNYRTPIVILTGLLANEHPRLVEAQKKCGEFFQTKPIHPDTLYDLLCKPSQQ